jgi:prepilin-type N-terminal cleavage/methylation domain-containing protein
MRRVGSASGFSLIELLVATTLFLVVSTVVTTALMQMTNSQKTIWNRTEMHSGVRGATELLQQEVGQAGRITLPTTVTLSNAITSAVSPCSTPLAATVNSTSGMFIGEQLTTFDGDSQETVAITSITSATQFTACFTKNHGATTTLVTMGGFATGIVPANMTNGSTANILKLYGDINGDGDMVYVEYYCDNGDAGTAGSHNLYRNVVAFNAAPPKPTVTNSQILLSNIYPNPGGTPCFQYQPQTIVVQGTSYTFILDVAVTLTVQTQQLDPITRRYQTETKALLNVSPRNVFNAWAYAGMGYSERIQPTPPSITLLLP